MQSLAHILYKLVAHYNYGSDCASQHEHHWSDGNRFGSCVAFWSDRCVYFHCLTFLVVFPPERQTSFVLSSLWQICVLLIVNIGGDEMDAFYTNAFWRDGLRRSELPPQISSSTFGVQTPWNETKWEVLAFCFVLFSFYYCKQCLPG